MGPEGGDDEDGLGIYGDVEMSQSEDDDGELEEHSDDQDEELSDEEEVIEVEGGHEIHEKEAKDKPKRNFEKAETSKRCYKLVLSKKTDYRVGGKRKRSASNSSLDEVCKRKQAKSSGSGSVKKQKQDRYCWVCHKVGVQTLCKTCPRSYHSKCIPASEDSERPVQSKNSFSFKNCVCPECVIVKNADDLETRSDAMKNLTTAQLISILQYACQELRKTPGADPFIYPHPVDTGKAVDYFQSIVYPMDLITLENNVKKGKYGSLEAFHADAQWIVHNSAVLNSVNSLMAASKKVLEVCREEIQDIEACLECYVKAHENDNEQQTWFVEACRRPHILVWVKLKGYRRWPAKAMHIKDEMVDVSFFGTHDKAWVPRKDCYLYSEQYPGVQPKKPSFVAAIAELNVHVEKLKELHGPIKLERYPYTPITSQSLQSIKWMLPEYKPEDPPVRNIVTEGMPQQSAKKSPTTIPSSLKTNPAIAGNATAVEGSKPGHTSKSKLGSKTSAPIPSGNKDGEPGPTDENKERDNLEEEQEQNSADENDKHSSSGAEPAKPNGILVTALAGRPTGKSSHLETGSTSSAVAGKLQNKSESTEAEYSRDATPPSPESLFCFLGLEESSEVAKSKKIIGGSSQPGAFVHPSQVFEKQKENQQDEGAENIVNALNGEPISVLAPHGAEEAQTLLKSKNHLHPQTKNFMHELPSSVSLVVENLQKSVQSNLEHIVSKLIEKVNSSDIGLEVKALKDENERLKKQVEELEEYKLDQSTHIQSVICKLRAAFTVDKDQALTELRKQLEQDETKKVNSSEIGLEVEASKDENERLMKQVEDSEDSDQDSDYEFEQMLKEAEEVEEGTEQRKQLELEKNKNVNSSEIGLEVKAVKDEIERLKKQVEELEEHKRNQGTVTRELKEVLMADKIQALTVLRQKFDLERNKVIEETKKLRQQLDLEKNKAVEETNKLAQQLEFETILKNNAHETKRKLGEQLELEKIWKNEAKEETNKLRQQLELEKNKAMEETRKLVQQLEFETILKNKAHETKRKLGEQLELEKVWTRDETNKLRQQLDLEKNKVVEETKKLVQQLQMEKILTNKALETKRKLGEQLELERIMKNNVIKDTQKLRQQLDLEKNKAVENTKKLRQQLELEKNKAVEETKKKTWCALCGREAELYCCWNIAYCGYSCQEKHWPAHGNSCSQASSSDVGRQ